MKRYLLLLLIVFVIISNFGCVREESDIYVDTVRKYNKMLVMALQSSNGELMSGITSKREEGRITIFISTLDLKNQYMKAHLDSFKVLESRKMTDKEREEETRSNPFEEKKDTKNKNPMARVKTDELWRYTNYDLKSRKPVTKMSRMHYQMTYILEFLDKKWIVRNVIFDKEEAI